MQRTASARRPAQRPLGRPARGRRPVALAATLAAALAATLLAACTSGSASSGDAGPSRATGDSGTPGATSAAPSSSAATSAAAAAAVITASPVSAENAISPAEPVTVSIAHGELSKVSLLNPAGKQVKGKLAADRTSWRSAEVLGYDKTYKLTATGKNADGVAVTKKSSIATVAPDNYTMPSITDIYGTGISGGATYGVGMVARVHFDEAVNRKAAEKTLSVSTTPKVTGGWYWNDDQNVYWRPKHYYPTGTKVSIAAKVYGKKLGEGLYGQADRATDFTIGQKRVSVASPTKHNVKVYFDGKLERTMLTSMGKGGYEPSNSAINYWTMHGTYTVITHENPAIMTSGSYGVPKSSPNYYPPEKIYYSTKISTDGIYLHELNTTIWAQGHQNVSHGCLNLRTADAKWFYSHSRVGDVVKVTKGLGNPEISFDQGGQWSVPWSTWAKGSALT
ncbi:Lipoprotein-anchoring transpeptidase ErfK/SrfK [Jatrophihabitans endophyticus]|uniref:Lipoprotein-anchoring transpeptidase ErfK/SrfK n=1 Tax=Jatrophihabitans endophyticus TaxID=1206085 RepID=A0A1M5K7L3_9ACTN|nr:Ig-like domain-containing protein [Jatrophihabitans endophyticus]SHG48590.1 Lipoprotein-anchoring transpeptidase ErfK/SrfK [Jatrophihabitans endophyticus]